MNFARWLMLGIIVLSSINIIQAKFDLKRKLLRYTNTNGVRNGSLAIRQRSIAAEKQQLVLKSMILKFYKNNTKIFEASPSMEAIDKSGCSPSDKFAIILHGWIQSCEDEWALSLINRLSYYRGGCIICIDYSVLAKSSYMRLYAYFDYITDAITTIVKSFVSNGFDTSRGYMFGFSFGGQLASAVGRMLRPKNLFSNIDTCDMAGPGFDPVAVDHSKAAKHVQCFHSSRDKGTMSHDKCHRNVMLGNCGIRQPSVASQLHLGSHGLCLDIYINSFDYPFYALKSRPKECPYYGDEGSNAVLPNDYTVGYEENFNKQVVGKIFVPTSLHYPYNFARKELKLIYKNIF